MEGTGKALFVSSAVLLTLYRSFQSSSSSLPLPPSPSHSHSPQAKARKGTLPRRKVWFGKEGLARLKSKARSEISPLDDLSLFVQWCRKANADRLQTDEEYRLKTSQRNLRARHREQLSSLQQRLQEAQERWKGHRVFGRYQTLLREVEGKEKAVTNMERFTKIDLAMVTKESEREKIARTRLAYESSSSELRALKEELAGLLTLPEYQQIVSCQTALERLTSSLGLDEIKADLATTQKERGSKRGERGRCFEDDSAEAVLAHLVPHLKQKFNLSEAQEKDLLIVRNITLGIASCASSPGEFDAMVCLRTSPWHDDGTPAARSISRKNPQQCPLFSCIVLAVVEAKRNPDDLGTAFSGLQGVMAWLCGKKDAYCPSDWTNRNYPSGHFDRPFLHAPLGLVFDSCSFSQISSYPVSFLISSLPPQGELTAKMTRSPLCFAEDLYFVTRDGEFDNLTSREHSVLIHRLASDLEFDDELTDRGALDSLRLSLRSQNELRTSEVIRLLEGLRLENQLLVIGG